jgi:CTP:molybdopterin cytidylyltransferase MocA
MLQHVLDAAAAGGLDDIVVVLGAAASQVAAGVALPPGTRTVVNADHAAGHAGSLAVGLGSIATGANAAMILLGDQPEVRVDAIAALVAAHAASEAPILRAAYRGRASHPVVLVRTVWAEAMALRGDAGARALIASHAGRVELVEVGGDPPEDVDTPADLDRLRRRRANPPAR